ncbi:acetyltransferase-like isoleucine patch superfamily enzyme [Pedobacter sp. AK017]|uniref:acyltransferase n=1 Tax=Pedobacter sp. AK017 TaxID=2723073 RepID=UPI001607B1A2|nr:acyltransferase [Pedobacter sp. AK017]MBB5439630.1 acetyltransferase-like isoleucine patch superfamily enzyme [Pedobacter sp. AK017]
MIKKIYRFLKNNPITYFHTIYRKLITNTLYRYTLQALGKNTIIHKPLLFTNECISIGNSVYIWPNARIEGVFRYAGVSYTPEIFLDDFCSIQQNVHITCADKIYIGKYTAIAANVSITDIHHQYDDINIPIENQQLHVKTVHIDNDCKIYNNVVILPGTHIGKHCTVGANSVVKGVFPDFSIIVGAPAKIIKRYNSEMKEWARTDSKGDFLKK